MTDNDHPRWAKKVINNTLFGKLGWVRESACSVSGHSYEADRAVNLEPLSWVRYFPEEDKEPKRVDGCTVIDICTSCGKERRKAASVETAEMQGASLEFNG